MYIRSRNLDSFFIIAAPLFAFAVIALVSEPRYISGEFLLNPRTPQWLVIMAAMLTHSHVMLVFLRSHGNNEVFKRFKFRFLAIPVLLVGAMWINPVFFGIMGFIALYWDEWHSLMQTFGFGRIYDVKLGNNPDTGRKLDMGMCFVLGLLPHVLLLTFIPEADRVNGLVSFLDLEQDVAEKYGHFIHLLKYPLLSFGAGYILFYIHQYSHLIRNGYKFSSTKLWLFGCTGLSAILIASLYSVEDSAYFGNIYHAIQYYFIIYVSEVPVLAGKVAPPDHKKRNLIVIVMTLLIISLALSLAYARKLSDGGVGFMGIFWLTTSLLHFWYDGFIWSVRKKDI